MFIVFCANFCNNPHAVMAKHTYTKELIEENVHETIVSVLL